MSPAQMNAPQISAAPRHSAPRPPAQLPPALLPALLRTLGRGPVRALGLAVLGLAALASGACGGDQAASGGPPPWARGGGGPPAAMVTTAAVEEGPFSVSNRFVGTLEAEVSADLYARVAGPIVAVRADTGDRVSAGQVLAIIDPVDAEQQVAQAQAALRVAEATIAQRRANLEVAEATARRTKALFDQDLISQQDYDTAEANRVGAAAQLELSEAQVAQARANLRTAQVEMEKTRVVAPFAGYVGQRFLDLGDLATTSRPVFSLVDLSTIETTLSITEKDLAYLQVGQDAEVTSGAYPGRTFDGRVERIASVFDPETNTIEAEIAVSNPERLLKPGMLAEVSITLGTQPSALLVPASAVVESERANHVFIAQLQTPREEAGGEPQREGSRAPASAGGSEGGRPGAAGGAQSPSWIARRVPVRILGRGADGQLAIAPEGLELDPGARVIVLGQESLSDGASVVLTGDGPSQPSATTEAPRPAGREA